MIRKKGSFFGSSPMWPAVCEFSFCCSEEYIVHCQTFGEI